jgi:hypothetical protein
MHNAGNRKVNMKLKIYEAGEQLNRIANALEEILRLVKLDQEKMAKGSRMKRENNDLTIISCGRITSCRKDTWTSWALGK